MTIPVTPTMCLNRVYIAGLPGLDVPDEVKGRTAAQLLSASALTRLVRRHIHALRMDVSLSDHALRLAYDATLASDVPSIRNAPHSCAAHEIAETMGRRLGYVLLALRRGDDVNRKARSEWTSMYWDHWSQISRVWLGGGLVSGNLGQYISHHAGQVMLEGGVQGYSIQVSPRAAHVPLIGAARHASPGATTCVVVDFGGTMIKRAWAVFKDDQIVGLHHLPSQAIARRPTMALNETTPEQARALIECMVSVIVDTWHDALKMGSAPAKIIPVSIAAYIENGNPSTRQGSAYIHANLATDNLEAELGRQASVRLDTPVSILLLHDGTAAAAAYAGQQHTAVITLGTALGIGFPGDSAGLRRVSDDLVVS